MLLDAINKGSRYSSVDGGVGGAGTLIGHRRSDDYSTRNTITGHIKAVTGVLFTLNPNPKPHTVIHNIWTSHSFPLGNIYSNILFKKTINC